MHTIQTSDYSSFHSFCSIFSATTRNIKFQLRNLPLELAESCENTEIQLSDAAASSPIDGVTGDQETDLTGEESSPESSKTCLRMGPIAASSGESGEGK